MIKVIVDGKHIGHGRIQLLKRAVDIINSKNPDIDWDSSDLILTVVTKEDKKDEKQGQVWR